DRPEDKARGADLLEVHRAGKVVAARHQGFERRRQASLECNEAADRRGRALAYRDPHAIGLLGEPRPLDAVDADHDAIATLPPPAAPGPRNMRRFAPSTQPADTPGCARSARWRVAAAKPAAIAANASATGKPTGRFRAATAAATVPARSAIAAHDAGSCSVEK